MDRMAYLQQIAGVDNSMNSKAKSNNPLSKLLNVWTFVIIGVLLVVIIGIAAITAMLNKVDTKDQDLMTRSYWMSSYLMDETIGEYSNEIKNSDIRNMTASLKSVLNEIILNDQEIMLTEYGIEIDDFDEEENEIVAEELESNNELNKTLEEARLNGILDRIYLREITMQIAYLKSYQSEIVERTENEAARNFAMKAEANLNDLYNQFHNFKSLTI